MGNSSGLKGVLGLAEPAQAGSAIQAKEFKRKFSAIIDPMGGQLQYLCVNAPTKTHAGLDAKRGKLYQAYQAAYKSIDPADAKKADGKIRKVLSSAKDSLGKQKSVVEETKAAHQIWIARLPDYQQITSKIDELDRWDDAAAAKFHKSTAAIDGKANERQWADATGYLDKVVGALQPVYDEFRRQLAAKEAYDAQRPVFDAAFEAAGNHPTPSARMGALTGQIETQLGAIEAHVAKKDFVAALDLLEGLVSLLGELETAKSEQTEREQSYQREMPKLQGRLGELGQSKLPQLDESLRDAESGLNEAAKAADSGDYEQALALMEPMDGNLSGLESERDRLEELRRQYEDLARSLLPRAAQAAQCNHKSLVALQGKIAAITAKIEAAAKADQFEEALSLCETLKGLLADYEERLACLAKHEALYKQRLAGLRPRLDSAKQSNYPSLADVQTELDLLDKEMTGAATAGDFEAAVAVMEQIEPKLQRYESDLAAIEEMRRLYDSRLKSLQSDLADATTCEFQSLESLQLEIDRIRTEMEAKVTAGDYKQALLEMDKLVPKLEAFKQALENARAKKIYDDLLAELEPRLGDAAVSNYGPLESLAAEIASDHDAARAAADAEDYLRGADILTRAAPEAGRL